MYFFFAPRGYGSTFERSAVIGGKSKRTEGFWCAIKQNCSTTWSRKTKEKEDDTIDLIEFWNYLLSRLVFCLSEKIAIINNYFFV